jgi:hypothetical protein
MALSPSAAANRRFGFQIKPEITPPPIPTNPGTAPAKGRVIKVDESIEPDALARLLAVVDGDRS